MKIRKRGEIGRTENINYLKKGCNLESSIKWRDRFRGCLCGLVVRVLGYRSRGPGSIPGATRFSEK
jgi:hypothetical protein